LTESGTDSDQRLDNPRSFTRWTSSRLHQSIFSKREVAVSASSGDNLDSVTCCGGGPQRAPQVVLDLAPAQAHLARQRRRRTWFMGYQLDQLAPEHRWRPSFFRLDCQRAPCRPS